MNKREIASKENCIEGNSGPQMYLATIFSAEETSILDSEVRLLN